MNRTLKRRNVKSINFDSTRMSFFMSTKQKRNGKFQTNIRRALQSRVSDSKKRNLHSSQSPLMSVKIK